MSIVIVIIAYGSTQWGNALDVRIGRVEGDGVRQAGALVSPRPWIGHGIGCSCYGTFPELGSA